MTDSATSATPAPPPYWCFISYRRTDDTQPGRRWATWLHQQIEGYEVPADLVGTTNQRGEIIPLRIFPVFRDEEELAASANLASPVFRALERSLTLVVLCSPDAVRSSSVCNGIFYFKHIGRSDRILAAVVGGEPNASWDTAKQAAGADPSRECFPIPLQFALGADGNLVPHQRVETIVADFRLPNGTQGWTSPEAFRQTIPQSVPKGKADAVVSAYQKQCELACLRIIAGILAVPLDSLTRRDKASLLEDERQNTRTFRRLAGALGILFFAALAAAIFAILKQQEAVPKPTPAGEATAIVTQAPVETAGDEARQDLQRANDLLREASSAAWSEANRFHEAGDTQGALASLASGMRKAPENTALLTFAACLLGDPGHPVRTLSFEHPVANVASTRTDHELIVAELLYSTTTRYSLWNSESIEKLDEVLVPTGTAITAAQKAGHPWLEFAPPARQSNKDGADTLEPVYSPCSMRTITGDQRGVHISGEGLAWNHPWYGLGSDTPGFTLPGSARPTGYAWSPDGNRVITAHRCLDSASEQDRGRVCLWDLRGTPGFSLLPGETTTPGGLPPADPNMSVQGKHLLLARRDGYDIFLKGGKDPLWSLEAEPGAGSVGVTLFSATDEAIVLRAATATGPLALERRDLATGRIYASATGPDFDPSRGMPTVTLHPADGSYAIVGSKLLLAWDGQADTPTQAKDMGPADQQGWGGSAAFLPDGKALLCASGRKLMLLTWPELRLTAGPRYHETMIPTLAISPDGTRAVSTANVGESAGSPGFVQLWALPGLTPIGNRLHHARQVETVGFVNKGHAFFSSAGGPEGSDIRLWDSRSALPLTTPLAVPPGTGHSVLRCTGIDEGAISSVHASGEVDAFGNGSYHTRLPTPQEPVPAWFHEHFLPYAACTTLSAAGSLEAVPLEALHGHYKALQAKLSASPPAEDDPYLCLARWFLANPSGRPINPFDPLTLDAFLDAHYFAPLREGKEDFDGSGAYAFDASHPLLHIHLALNEKNAEKQLHYLRYGYYRLSRPSNEETYGKERWHEQMRTGQKLLTILKQPGAVEELGKILNEG